MTRYFVARGETSGIVFMLTDGFGHSYHPSGRVGMSWSLTDMVDLDCREITRAQALAFVPSLPPEPTEAAESQHFL